METNAFFLGDRKKEDQIEEAKERKFWEIFSSNNPTLICITISVNFLHRVFFFLLFSSVLPGDALDGPFLTAILQWTLDLMLFKFYFLWFKTCVLFLYALQPLKKVLLLRDKCDQVLVNCGWKKKKNENECVFFCIHSVEQYYWAESSEPWWAPGSFIAGKWGGKVANYN